MSDSANDKSNTLMILSCSGGCNVGQLANRVAVELSGEGFGKMFCLAGVGGGLEDFVARARQAGETLVLDGCSAGCARAVFERADVPLTGYVVVTDHGIDRHTDLSVPLDPEDVAKLKMAAKSAVSFCRQLLRGPSSCCTWPEGEF
ncbi:putative zinc-binding protein [Fundidesulfovibrio butyratiphilus]